MNKNISYKAISIVFSVLTICFLMVFYSLAWIEPNANPPGGNVQAPLNTGSVAQIKSGPLRIGGVFRTDSATYLGVGGGNVGIGITNPSEKLSVSGNIRATGTMCDSNGCIGGGMNIVYCGQTTGNNVWKTNNATSSVFVSGTASRTMYLDIRQNSLSPLMRISYSQNSSGYQNEVSGFVPAGWQWNIVSSEGIPTHFVFGNSGSCPTGL